MCAEGGAWFPGRSVGGSQLEALPVPVASDLNAERGDLAVDGLNEAELGLVLVAGDHSSGVWP
jgi:hypothetical protein